MRPSSLQAAHNGSLESCLARIRSHAAVLYCELKACRSIVGALLGVCASQYREPFTLWALHWKWSHCGRGIVGMASFYIMNTFFP